MTTTAERIEALGAEHTLRRGDVQQIRSELVTAVRRAVEAGMSESEAARLAGVTRMTVRAWQGKS